MQWLCHSPCKPGVADSIPGFSGPTDGTINHMTLAIGGTLNPNQSINQSINQSVNQSISFYKYTLTKPHLIDRIPQVGVGIIVEDDATLANIFSSVHCAMYLVQ